MRREIENLLDSADSVAVTTKAIVLQPTPSNDPGDPLVRFGDESLRDKLLGLMHSITELVEDTKGYQLQPRTHICNDYLRASRHLWYLV